MRWSLMTTPGVASTSAHVAPPPPRPRRRWSTHGDGGRTELRLVLCRATSEDWGPLTTEGDGEGPINVPKSTDELILIAERAVRR
jgi:hypothetical protein